MIEDGFYFQNSPGVYTKFQATFTRFTKNSQTPAWNPDELIFSAGLKVPIMPLSRITFIRDNLPVFHGYAIKRDNSQGYWNITCKSSQWALSWRYIPDFTYHDVDLNTVFASGVPTTGAAGTVGALFFCNSLIPNGKWTAHSATVAKLVGGGTKSVLGLAARFFGTTSFPNAGTIDTCDGVVELASVAAPPTAAGKYYQDLNDFYVRLGDGSYMPNAYYVLAKDAFETGVRIGTIDIGTKKSNIDFTLQGQAAASIPDFFLKAGRETQFVPKMDGFVYLNAASELSRDTGRQYKDGENAWVSLADPKEPAVQAVIGLNTSDNPQPVTASNWSRRSPQLFKIFEDTSLSLTDLGTMVESLLDDNDQAYTITTNNQEWQLLPGDWIKIYREDTGWKDVRITRIDYGKTNMIISAGKRLFSPSQAFGSYFKKTILGPLTQKDAKGRRFNSKKKHRSTTTITAGVGTFTIYHDDVLAGGLTVLYEESFSMPEDDTAVDTGVYADVKVNGVVAPPGRIRISDNPSISIDITAACLTSTTLDVENTIHRDIYLATGWGASDGVVNLYRAMAFIDP
jgi:hypothetical protein